MADLKNQIIATSYHKLLQVSSSGELADGRGDNLTLNINGKDTYVSESANLTKALTVTGSIIPEGVDKWDLGSPTNPFRDLWLSEESLKFVKTVTDPKTGRKVAEVSKLSKTAVDSLLRGEIVQRIDNEGRELAVAKPGYSTSQRITSTNNTNTYQTFDRDKIQLVVDGVTLLELNKSTGITTIGGNVEATISTTAVETDKLGDVMLKDVEHLNNEYWEIAYTSDTEIHYQLKEQYFSTSDNEEAVVYFG
tara:strand:- start:319 stop:1068 length:750 start_codon:yes stop_codon:yes gene_type:complete